MYDLIFSSSSTASRCSACRTSTSPTSSISVTFPWGRSTSSPSSSWPVWSCCGSSRPPRLPSSSPWWWMDGSHSTPEMSKNHKLFLQQLTFSRAGAGSGVYQEADGLHLQQERAELAGRPHAREQEEEAGGRWWGDDTEGWLVHRFTHFVSVLKYIDTALLPMSPGGGRRGGAEYRGRGGRSCASAIRRVQVSRRRHFDRNCSSERPLSLWIVARLLSMQRDPCHQHHRWNVQGLLWKHVERQQLRILKTTKGLRNQWNTGQSD